MHSRPEPLAEGGTGRWPAAMGGCHLERARLEDDGLRVSLTAGARQEGMGRARCRAVSCRRSAIRCRPQETWWRSRALTSPRSDELDRDSVSLGTLGEHRLRDSCSDRIRLLRQRAVKVSILCLCRLASYNSPRAYKRSGIAFSRHGSNNSNCVNDIPFTIPVNFVLEHSCTPGGHTDSERRASSSFGFERQAVARNAGAGATAATVAIVIARLPTTPPWSHCHDPPLMACPRSIFAAAVDLIARADSDGLPLTAAVSTATGNPAPRPALVAWLLRALRESDLPVDLACDSAGGWVATARMPMRLRALGHCSLEHPVLGDQPARALTALGVPGPAGALQTDLSELLGLAFSTAHHYLLSLLACDLVVRRRVQFERVADVATDLSHDAAGVTSNIVVSRFVSPGGSGFVLPVPATGPPSALQRRMTEPLKPKIEVIFELCCRIVAVLRECPGASASQQDLKNQLLVPSDRRHRDFAAARQKLLRANIITVEDSMCLDSRGCHQGIQSCLRLAPEHCTLGRPTMKTDVGAGALDDGDGDVDFADSSLLGVIGAPMSIDDCGAHAVRTECASADCPRGNPSCELTNYSVVLEKALERHSSIMQASYEMLERHGTKGLSYVDLHHAFGRIINKRQAKMVYRGLKAGTRKIEEALIYHGRTRRHTLFLELPMDGGRRTLSEKKLAGMLPGPLQSAVQTSIGSLGHVVEKESDHPPCPAAPHIRIDCADRGIEDDHSLSPSSPAAETHYEPTPLKGMSHLAVQRVQIANGVLRRYGVVRVDKLGRIIGAIEGKDYFHVDRRVVDRVLECLFRDGKAKKFSLPTLSSTRPDYTHDSSSAACAIAGEDVSDAPREVGEVPFVCLPDFDVKASNVRKQVLAAHARLFADLPLMKAPKQPEYLRKYSSSRPSVEAASNDATFVSVACRNPELPLKKPSSVTVELKRCLARLIAVDYGWMRALIPRARLLHKLFIQRAKFQLGSQRSAAAGVLAVVSENDVVGNMTPRDYAQIVGVYSSIDYPLPLADNVKFSHFPLHVRNVLLSSPYGKNERAVLTSLLSRIGLITRCPGSKLWLVHDYCTLRDFGKGAPASVVRRSIRFDGDVEVEKFWSQLELYKDMQDEGGDSAVNAMAQAEERRDDSDAVTSVDPDGGAMSKTTSSAVEEIYDRHHWSVEEAEPLRLSVGDQAKIENLLQSKIALLPSSCKNKLPQNVAFEKLDWFTEEERAYLYSQVNRYLQSDVPYESVVAQVRFRFANPLSHEARSRIEEARDENTSPSHRKARREVNGRESTRRKKRRRRVSELGVVKALPLVAPGRRKRAKIGKKSGLEQDTKLLVLVSELRAVVDSEALLQVTPGDTSTGWHLRGLHCFDNSFVEGEMRQLWADVAKAVDLSIAQCQRRVKQLCNDPDVLVVFQDAVVALRNQELYPLDVGLSPSVQQIDAAIEDAAVSPGFDASLLFREALESRFVRETNKRKAVSECKAALNARLCSDSRAINEPAAVPCVPTVQSGPEASQDADDMPLVALPRRKSGVSGFDFVSPDLRSDSGIVEDSFELAILCRNACTKAGFPPNNFSVLGEKDGLGDEVRPRLCAQTILTILSEPRHTFELKDAIGMLRRFPLRLLVCTREALLSCARIRRRDPASTCGRMFCASPASEFSKQHGCAVLKGVETLRRLQQRLSLSGRNRESVNFYAPSISRLELLATLQCTFAHQSDMVFRTGLALMPSSFDNSPCEHQEASETKSRIEFGVEGSALLCYTRNQESQVDIDSVPAIAPSGNHRMMFPDRLDVVLSLMRKHCGQSLMVESTCMRIFEIIEAKASGSGVSMSGVIDELTSHGSSSLGSLSRVVSIGLAFMIEQRVVARVPAPMRPLNVNSGCEDIIYLPFELACRKHDAVSGAEIPSQRHAPIRVQPLTPWSRMDGSLDDAYCHQVQAKIISALKLAPGADETKLLASLKPFDFPEQVVRDVLWALTRHNVVNCVYRNLHDDSCSLFSIRGSILPRESIDPVVLHFVDGILTQKPRQLVISYFLRGLLQPRLLDADEVVRACESSPGLRDVELSPL